MKRLVGWAAVAAVLAGVTASVLRLRPDVSLAGPSVAAQALEIAAAAVLIAAAGAAGRGAGRWLLPAAGAGWLAAEWASPAAPGAAALTVGLVTAMAAPPLVLASRWQRPAAASHREAPGAGRLPGARGPAVLLALGVLALLAAAVASGPLAAAVASPRDAGCTDCARDLVAVAHDVALSAALNRLGGQLTAVAGLIAVVWLGCRLASARRSQPAAGLRRAQVPWLSADLAADAAAAGFAVAVAAGAATALRGGPAGAPAYGWHAVAGGMLLVLGAAVAGPAVRAARARRLVAQATVALANEPEGSAAGALAAALGDPALRVAYPAPGGTWHDHRGQPLVLPGQGVTTVADGGEIVAALIHSGPLRGGPALTAMVSAARLLLDTERIEAGMLARAHDLRAARRRVAEAADASRSRLERDLHDGAQQRLVALRYALGLAAARAAQQPDPATAARLADADLAAERALADLRDLAHGISAGPAAGQGLADAVRSAAEQAQGTVTITELPAEPLPARAEQGVYRLIADCLRQAPAAPGTLLSVAVRRAGGDVAVEFGYDRDMISPDWPPAHLADRVAAVGGRLQQADHHGHGQLIAWLPCE